MAQLRDSMQKDSQGELFLNDTVYNNGYVACLASCLA
jgi:hypothetical protein